jgi:ribonuclease R
LKPFLIGDVVDAELVEESDGRFSAKRLQLVERARAEVFGRVVVKRGKRYLRPDPQVSPRDWPLGGRGAERLEEDQPVVAAVEGRSLKLVETVDDADVPRVQVLCRWGIRRTYPAACLRAAKKAGGKLDLRGRRDLRDVITVTIDAPKSRDLDDALSVLPSQPDGAVRVLVSIADVDAHVPAGGPVDREARARGTSVYLPDAVLNMIPPALSEQSVSLLPDVERLAMTVELRIDPEGEVTAVDIAESVIRSDARLSYKDVAAYLDEGRQGDLPSAVLDTLAWLRTAAARLSTVRQARGGVSVFREEAVIRLDPRTKQPTGVDLVPDTSAHRLVERLMVAANEAVASWLVARGLPGMFRVHAEPDEDRIDQLDDFAVNFGFATGFGHRLSPRALAAFEEQFRDTHVAPTMRTGLRKLLGPARYTVHPGLHFGLGSPLYLHFTSPIRRYADLVVHRLVKQHLEGDRTLEAGDPALEELGLHLNEAAFRGKKAESERARMLIAQHFAGRVGEVFESHVVGAKPFGLVIQLSGLGVTGTVACEELAGGPWRVDPVVESLVATAGKRIERHSIGEAMRVELVGVDTEAGRLEFKPKPASPKKRRRKKRS